MDTPIITWSPQNASFEKLFQFNQEIQGDNHQYISAVRETILVKTHTWTLH